MGRHRRGKPPRIYLAGPGVFLPDPQAAGRAKAHICRNYGLEGLFPLDAELALDGLGKQEQARRIAMANESLMRTADGIVASLTPFRGVSMDCGTAFEVGFMRALGRPVFGYTNTVVLFAKRVSQHRSLPMQTWDCDRPDIAIENFDLAENLMVTEAIGASGGTLETFDADSGDRLEGQAAFEVCVARAARYFGLLD